MNSAMATTIICPSSSPTLNQIKVKVMSCSLASIILTELANPIPWIKPDNKNQIIELNEFFQSF